MCYDDHKYCLVCGLHDRGCYCYVYHTPEEEGDDLTRVCPGTHEGKTQ